jgi:hypothetical protein
MEQVGVTDPQPDHDVAGNAAEEANQ